MAIELYKVDDTCDLTQDFEKFFASLAAPEAAAAQQVPESFRTSKRKQPRYPVHWRAAIINTDGRRNDVYHGRTHNVSLSGVNILLERNVLYTPEVVVLLAIPAIHPGERETIVEAQCSTLYTWLDSAYSQFRFVLQFIRFKGDGQRILSEVLARQACALS